MDTTQKYLTVADAHKVIAEFIANNPSVTYVEVAELYGYSLSQIGVIARKHGLSRPNAARRSRVPATLGVTRD